MSKCPLSRPCERGGGSLVVITCNLCLPINAQGSGAGVGADGVRGLVLMNVSLREEKGRKPVTLFFFSSCCGFTEITPNTDDVRDTAGEKNNEMKGG